MTQMIDRAGPAPAPVFAGEATEILITGFNQVEQVPTGLERVDLLPRQMRIATLCSAISAGTELSYLKGTNPFLYKQLDEDRLFVDKPSKGYPQDSGYMQTGMVVESSIEDVPEGSIVAMAYGHKNMHIADEGDRYTVLPEWMDPEVGTLVAHMGPICANGVLYGIDDRLGHLVRQFEGTLDARHGGVIGAGVVGQLTTLFAMRAGVEVRITDTDQRRLAVAEKLGMKTVPTEIESDDDLPRYLKQLWTATDPKRKGAELMWHCTGSIRALIKGLKSLRTQGTMVDMGFYQTDAAGLRLGEEPHHNILRYVVGQIGETPWRQQPDWDRPALRRQTISLLAEHGAAIKDHLITHRVSFSQAQCAYDLLGGADPEANPLLVVMYPD